MTTPISPGGKAWVQVMWRNKGAAPYAPSFRLDLRRSGWGATWTEGPILRVAEARPTEAVTDMIYAIVPSNWGPQLVDAKLHVIGIDAAVWVAESVFEIL